MLEITYTNSFLDLAFGKTRATIRHPVVIISNLAILAVLGLCLLHDTDHNHSVVLRVFVMGVILSFLAGLGAAFILLVCAAHTWHDIRTGGKEGHLGPHTVTVTEDKISEVTSANKSEWNLRNVVSVYQTRKSIYVFVTPSLFLLIPKQSLADEAGNFYKTLMEMWLAAKQGTSK